MTAQKDKDLFNQIRIDVEKDRGFAKDDYISEELRRKEFAREFSKRLLSALGGKIE